MDKTDPDIFFNGDGVCGYCRQYEETLKTLPATEDEGRQRWQSVTETIKAAGRDREYDSILGLSGGVDSSYMAYLAAKAGLKPLVVHFDNGWNSELAVQNIYHIVDKLGLELYTYVIDWEEFRDLQRSFFLASVIDIEMITDHAIAASMIRIARQHGIPYVLSGTNSATESGLPKAWYWNKQDLTNIKAIQKRFGTKKLKSFPTFNIRQWISLQVFKPFRVIEPLNLVRYSKREAMDILSRELGWQYYGGKHYESIFTRFYQAFVLPEKFGVDKRKAHFSSLIRNGEMTREQALEALREPPYEPEALRRDREYVLKKLGFTEEEFDRIMKTPVKSHIDYPSEVYWLAYAKNGARWFKNRMKWIG
jgi:N-acetyl sugar amidotransferase